MLHGVKKNSEVEGFGIFLWPHGNGTVRSAASVFLWGGGWLESGAAFPSGLRDGRVPVPVLPVGSIYHAREEQHDVRDEDAEDDDAHGDEDKGQGAVGNVLKGGVGDA